jgi:ornithine--oxo-acid transaminase
MPASKQLHRTASMVAKQWGDELLHEFKSPSQLAIAQLEGKVGSRNYHPLPVVLCRGLKHNVWDIDGTKYMDFLGAYSSVNQGHCHPRIVEAVRKQADILTLTSRAFYTDTLSIFEDKITKLLGYDRVLPMNTGAEAVETSIKICRRWGYRVKGIPAGKARLIFMDGNFHGRTYGAISASNDPESKTDFGPFLPGIDICPFGDAQALEAMLAKQGRETAAVFLEPIQGEAGIVVPAPGYLERVRELTKQHNVLMACDEVQTGLGRTGSMLRCDAERVRPDVIMLGKALSGGMLPISCVMADDEVMLVLDPGSHGSTYGGNPMAARCAVAALDVILDEKLSERAFVLGERFRKRLAENLPRYASVRGAGLLNAVVVKPAHSKSLDRTAFAMDVCLDLLHHKRILAKPTHQDIIRFGACLLAGRAVSHHRRKRSSALGDPRTRLGSGRGQDLRERRGRVWGVTTLRFYGCAMWGCACACVRLCACSQSWWGEVRATFTARPPTPLHAPQRSPTHALLPHSHTGLHARTSPSQPRTHAQFLSNVSARMYRILTKHLRMRFCTGMRSGHTPRMLLVILSTSPTPKMRSLSRCCMGVGSEGSIWLRTKLA